MRFPFLAVSILSLTLVACGEPLAPEGGRQVQPTVEQRALWSHLEDCSGLHGDIENVRFYISDHGPRGGWWGWWHPDAWGSSITIWDQHAGNVQLWGHEMMHALLKRGDHPPEYFNGKCGVLNPEVWVE